MNDRPEPIVFLSGAGGGAPDLGVFKVASDDTTRFEVVAYPGWKRYVSDGFSMEALIADLADEIAARIPRGRIRIVGLSIGGHFGYAIALRLQEMGRDIGGFCAIDTFMIASSKPSAGWKGRALSEIEELIRQRRFGDFGRFLRSRFWRALARLAGDRLPSLLRRLARSRLSRSGLFAIDPIFEEELSMRLLIGAAAPWIASLDRKPVPLTARAVLLRTMLSDSDDAAWRRRCPGIAIVEISGRHHSLFEPENVASLHRAFVSATHDW